MNATLASAGGTVEIGLAVLVGSPMSKLADSISLQVAGSERCDVVLPSVISSQSWNLLIDVAGAAGMFSLRSREPFALDPRLNPAGAPRKAKR